MKDQADINGHDIGGHLKACGVFLSWTASFPIPVMLFEAKREKIQHIGNFYFLLIELEKRRNLSHHISGKGDTPSLEGGDVTTQKEWHFINSIDDYAMFYRLVPL